jgi:negative regulator of flagellin synthesis FlgM
MAVLDCRKYEERTMSSFEIRAPGPVSAVQATALGAGAKAVQTETPKAADPAVKAPTVKALAGPAAAPARASAAAAQVETSDAVKAGVAPVDQERVREIRQAIESGKYPIVPAKIADAMIAAGMLLRSPHS